MGPSPERALTPRQFVEECFAFKRDHAPQAAASCSGSSPASARRERAASLGEGRLLLHGVPRRRTSRPGCRCAPIVPDRDDLPRHRAQPGRRAGLHQGEPRTSISTSSSCDGLGISLDEARAHLPLASTLGAAAAVGFFCRSSFEEGLGAFGLAVEMQVPGRPVGADVIYHALRDNYSPRRSDARVLRRSRRGRGRARRERDDGGRVVRQHARAAGARAARVPLERARAHRRWPKDTTRCSIGDVETGERFAPCSSQCGRPASPRRPSFRPRWPGRRRGLPVHRKGAARGDVVVPVARGGAAPCLRCARHEGVRSWRQGAPPSPAATRASLERGTRLPLRHDDLERGAAGEQARDASLEEGRRCPTGRHQQVEPLPPPR